MKIWLLAIGCIFGSALEAMYGDDWLDENHYYPSSCHHCARAVDSWLPGQVDSLIKNKTDLNLPLSNSCAHGNVSKPPLVISASSDSYLRVTKRLLRHHANPNIMGSHRCDQPLLNAIIDGATRTVKVLLKAGANPHVRGYQNNPLLHLACFHARGCSCTKDATNIKNYIRNVELLLQYGADPNQLNDFGNTPLSELIFGGAHKHGGERILPIIQHLLLFGADINLKKQISKKDDKIAQFLKDWRAGTIKLKKKKLR